MWTVARCQHLSKALHLLWLCLLLPVLAAAAVPNDRAKPAYAEEQTILQQEAGMPAPGLLSPDSGRHHFDRHYLIAPGFTGEQDLILQRGGNTWRLLRNGPLATIAGFLLLVVPLLIFGFYQSVGAAPEPPASGRRLLRFSAWDRLVHWATAITFLILAASGLTILFGKNLLLPWMGHSVFAVVALVAKYLHNLVGPLFIACSVVMFFNWVRENLFRQWDWNWIRRGGGLLRHEHIAAGYFNAGEKIWFWGGVTLLGLLMSVTGLMLDFPYLRQVGAELALTRYLLQVADYLHLAGATFYIAAAMGHIYIGTLGTPGAYHAMRHGDVDEAWAQAHHQLWYDALRGAGGAASQAPGPAADPDAPAPSGMTPSR